MSAIGSNSVTGHVSRGFEAVRDAFVDNFVRRGESGGACCAYYRGDKVVDIWGGVRNKQTAEPWERDTMVIVHSATKGLAAMTLALAHSRGWLDYEQPVCAYWPEFAQQGKERITVRQLLAHQAGLFALDEPVDRSVVADHDRLAVILARQKPAWEPGTRQAYHAITLGYYESELLRRVDPERRSLGRFFHDEIASPLGLDVYIRLPETIPNSRFATLAPPRRIAMLLGFPPRLMLASMNPHSNIVRALKGSDFPHDRQYVYARNTANASVIVAFNNDKKSATVEFDVTDTRLVNGATLFDRLGNVHVRVVLHDVPLQSGRAAQRNVRRPRQADRAAPKVVAEKPQKREDHSS